MRKLNTVYPVLLLLILISISCTDIKKIPVIFDTDANNEIDDQHALAYLFYNSATFDIRGITVNATYNGGLIDAHYEEAERIMKLCGWENKTPLLKGANKGFNEIKSSLDSAYYDGHKAVNFIIEEASQFSSHQKLIVLAVGKLTNVALAVKKKPSIIPNIRLVWLGSNYPEPGEYNQENDIESLNFLLSTDITFEMVTVRYGKLSGTDFVKVTEDDVQKRIAPLGETIATPVSGRHGGEYFSFGTYAISLFDNISYYGDPPSRSLFDMAAVAIVKNPSWAKAKEIPSPILIDKKWVEIPENNRKIVLWEYFDQKSILNDFYESLTADKRAID
tara:strand:- start:21592 stop:22590 length:999 start_codon:yes stop_codon:yes gene_type:complete